VCNGIFIFFANNCDIDRYLIGTDKHHEETGAHVDCKGTKVTSESVNILLFATFAGLGGVATNYDRIFGPLDSFFLGAFIAASSDRNQKSVPEFHISIQTKSYLGL